MTHHQLVKIADLQTKIGCCLCCGQEWVLNFLHITKFAFNFLFYTILDCPSISVTVLSERKVCYEGEETSISALSAKLKGYKVKHIQPTPHWFFNDRSLSEIYDETYPFEE